MRKAYCIVFFIWALVIPSIAQVAWGVRVGNGYSSLVYKVDDLRESGARFGYSLAGMVDIPVWNEFSLRPEIGFVSQGGSYLDDITMTVNCGGGCDSRFYQKSRYHYYSLQIPVNVCYTFHFSEVGVNLFGGPVADFPLFGKRKTEGKRHDMHFGSGDGDDMKSFDLGISVGLGAEYNNFMFAIHAVCGTFNRRPNKLEGESSVYQNNVMFSLGYFFRPRK